MDHTIFGSAFEFVRDNAGAATPKLTIPAPSLVHYRGGPAAIDHAVYPDIDEFWEDLGAAYADEVKRLGDIGCTYLQLDDTSLAYLNDPAQRAEITGAARTPTTSTRPISSQSTGHCWTGRTG